MKLWDSLTTCLIVLSAVHGGPPPRGTRRPPSVSAERGARAGEGPLELPPVQVRLSVSSPGVRAAEEEYAMEEPLPPDLRDVVEFIRVTISRIRRSSASATPSSTSSSATSSPSTANPSGRHRRERRKGPGLQRGGEGRGGAGVAGRKVRGGGGGVGGRGQGCVLKQIHLNVSDLGLGYLSGEEMIFRYCSGPCRKSETNYDKILSNLAHNRRFPPRDTPPQACCRPIAFDDDLSFLDDNLVYHTLKKHSARKCGCV